MEVLTSHTCKSFSPYPPSTYPHPTTLQGQFLYEVFPNNFSYHPSYSHSKILLSVLPIRYLVMCNLIILFKFSIVHPNRS